MSWLNIYGHMFECWISQFSTIFYFSVQLYKTNGKKLSAKLQSSWMEINSFYVYYFSYLLMSLLVCFFAKLYSLQYHKTIKNHSSRASMDSTFLYWFSTQVSHLSFDDCSFLLIYNISSTKHARCIHLHNTKWVMFVMLSFHLILTN